MTIEELKYNEPELYQTLTNFGFYINGCIDGLGITSVDISSGSLKRTYLNYIIYAFKYKNYVGDRVYDFYVYEENHFLHVAYNYPTKKEALQKAREWIELNVVHNIMEL
jgi:hypothetical protein